MAERDREKPTAGDDEGTAFTHAPSVHRLGWLLELTPEEYVEREQLLERTPDVRSHQLGQEQARIQERSRAGGSQPER